MASETDFLDMYRTLGLRPGCSLPDLKQAYRRHVSRMHPDRRGDAPADPVAAAKLQRLIAQYDAAMAFEREHGRLPGSVTRVRFAVPETASPSSPSILPGPRRSAWRLPVWALLLPAAALLALGWDMVGRPAPAPAAVSTDNAEEAQPQAASSTSAGTLALGMSRDDVRATLGEPLAVHGEQWEYGPSWVRFENDRVVDWYSSPLHALGAVASTPNSTPAIPSGSGN